MALKSNPMAEKRKEAADSCGAPAASQNFALLIKEIFLILLSGIEPPKYSGAPGGSRAETSVPQERRKK